MKVWCRGYKGRIKNVTDREVRIELEAQARTVTVRRDQIPPEDGGAPMPRPAPAFGAGSATPMHAGMRTPAYPSATPMHPSMTPSHPGESSEAWGRHFARATCTDNLFCNTSDSVINIPILLINCGAVLNRLSNAHARQRLGACHGDAASPLVVRLRPRLALGRALRQQGAVRLGRFLRSARWCLRGCQLDQRRRSAQ